MAAILVIGLLLNQYFLSMLAIQNQLGMTQAALLPRVGLFCTTLLESFFLSLLIPIRMEEHLAGRPSAPFMQVMNEHGKPLLIESIRVMASVLLWCLALIIPGIFKNVRYLFVPFVVLFDKDYQAGNCDALKKSNDLVKGLTLPLTFLFFAWIVAGYLVDAIRQRYSLIESPLVVIVGSIGTIALNAFVCCWLFALYSERISRINEKET